MLQTTKINANSHPVQTHGHKKTTWSWITKFAPASLSFSFVFEEGGGGDQRKCSTHIIKLKRDARKVGSDKQETKTSRGRNFSTQSSARDMKQRSGSSLTYFWGDWGEGKNVPGATLVCPTFFFFFTLTHLKRNIQRVTFHRFYCEIKNVSQPLTNHLENALMRIFLHIWRLEKGINKLTSETNMCQTWKTSEHSSISSV